jgi:hypothetical protein
MEGVQVQGTKNAPFEKSWLEHLNWVVKLNNIVEFCILLDMGWLAGQGCCTIQEIHTVWSIQWIVPDHFTIDMIQGKTWGEGFGYFFYQFNFLYERK